MQIFVPFFYVFVKLNAFNMSLLASECSEAPRQATIWFYVMEWMRKILPEDRISL